MSELKPCPFCGGEPDEYDGEYGNGIYCMQCGAMVGEPIHLGFNIAERVSYEQAAKAWNTRAEMGYEDVRILLDELGISERTCKNESADGFLCSSCSFGDFASFGYEPNYCPNCGAKVVKE